MQEIKVKNKTKKNEKTKKRDWKLLCYYYYDASPKDELMLVFANVHQFLQML